MRKLILALLSSGVGVNNAFESLPEIRELVLALQSVHTDSAGPLAAERNRHEREAIRAAVQARTHAADRRVNALVQRQLAVRPYTHLTNARRWLLGLDSHGIAQVYWLMCKIGNFL